MSKLQEGLSLALPALHCAIHSLIHLSLASVSHAVSLAAFLKVTKESMKGWKTLEKA